MRKLIPIKIQYAVEDIKARFSYAENKEQITAEQKNEVVAACDIILSMLPKIRRKRRNENEDDEPCDKIESD